MQKVTLTDLYFILWYNFKLSIIRRIFYSLCVQILNSTTSLIYCCLETAWSSTNKGKFIAKQQQMKIFHNNTFR